MLRHLGQRVDLVQQRLAALPEVVGDVRDRGARQRRPAAAALDAGHPVAQLVAGQPAPQAGSWAPANRPSACAANSPLLAASSTQSAVRVMPSGVLLDGGELGRPQAGGRQRDAGDDHVGLPPPVGEVPRVAQLGRVVLGRGHESLDHDRPTTDDGAPHPDRRRARCRWAGRPSRARAPTCRNRRRSAEQNPLTALTTSTRAEQASRTACSRTPRRGSGTGSQGSTTVTCASRGSASTSSTAGRSPPATTTKRPLAEDPYGVLGRRLVGLPGLVVPAPREPLLALAAGLGPALDVPLADLRLTDPLSPSRRATAKPPLRTSSTPQSSGGSTAAAKPPASGRPRVRRRRTAAAP